MKMLGKDIKSTGQFLKETDRYKVLPSEYRNFFKGILHWIFSEDLSRGLGRPERKKDFWDVFKQKCPEIKNEIELLQKVLYDDLVEDREKYNVLSSDIKEKVGDAFKTVCAEQQKQETERFWKAFRRKFPEIRDETKLLRKVKYGDLVKGKKRFTEFSDAEKEKYEEYETALKKIINKVLAKGDRKIQFIRFLRRQKLIGEINNALSSGEIVIPDPEFESYGSVLKSDIIASGLVIEGKVKFEVDKNGKYASVTRALKIIGPGHLGSQVEVYGTLSARFYDKDGNEQEGYFYLDGKTVLGEDAKIFGYSKIIDASILSEGEVIGTSPLHPTRIEGNVDVSGKVEDSKILARHDAKAIVSKGTYVHDHCGIVGNVAIYSEIRRCKFRGTLGTRIITRAPMVDCDVRGNVHIERSPLISKCRFVALGDSKITVDISPDKLPLLEGKEIVAKKGQQLFVTAFNVNQFPSYDYESAMRARIESGKERIVEEAPGKEEQEIIEWVERRGRPAFKDKLKEEEIATDEQIDALIPKLKERKDAARGDITELTDQEKIRAIVRAFEDQGHKIDLDEFSEKIMETENMPLFIRRLEQITGLTIVRAKFPPKKPSLRDGAKIPDAKNGKTIE